MGCQDHSLYARAKRRFGSSGEVMYRRCQSIRGCNSFFFGICPGSVYIAMAILSSSLSLILTRFSFFELFHMADYPTERWYDGAKESFFWKLDVCLHISFRFRTQLAIVRSSKRYSVCTWESPFLNISGRTLYNSLGWLANAILTSLQMPVKIMHFSKLNVLPCMIVWSDWIQWIWKKQCGGIKLAMKGSFHRHLVLNGLLITRKTGGGGTMTTIDRTKNDANIWLHHVINNV